MVIPGTAAQRGSAGLSARRHAGHRCRGSGDGRGRGGPAIV